MNKPLLDVETAKEQLARALFRLSSGKGMSREVDVVNAIDDLMTARLREIEEFADRLRQSA